MRRTDSKSEWVLPASTCSGHIEPASLKRQHVKASEGNENAVANAWLKQDGKPKKLNVEPFRSSTLFDTRV